MQLFTTVYSRVPLLFSPLFSSFPPGAGVCALERGDVVACLQRLRHKNDQETLVALYTESLPSHGSKRHKPTP